MHRLPVGSQQSSGIGLVVGSSPAGRATFHPSPLKPMRAVLAESPGKPSRVVEVEQPGAGTGEVLVRIEASGLNPLDNKIRAGAAPHARQPLPAILGLDLAGTVETVGPEVSRFHPGDRVYGMTGGVGGRQGSLAEFAAVDARTLSLIPKLYSMRQAAALPLAFVTAWEGLVDCVEIKAGDRVLIQGGAGGVGHVAVQIAKTFGATVYATASARKRDRVESLGAVFIDYAANTVDQYVAEHTAGRGFDVVFDCVGGAVLDASFQAVSIHSRRCRSRKPVIRAFLRWSRCCPVPAWSTSATLSERPLCWQMRAC
jgi:NADPH:quinone reductase